MVFPLRSFDCLGRLRMVLNRVRAQAGDSVESHVFACNMFQKEVMRGGRGTQAPLHQQLNIALRQSAPGTSCTFDLGERDWFTGITENSIQAKIEPAPARTNTIHLDSLRGKLRETVADTDALGAVHSFQLVRS